MSQSRLPIYLLTTEKWG